MFVNRWKEVFQEILSDHSQLNLELRMEVFVFNVMKKEISETRKYVIKYLYLHTANLQVLIATTTNIAIYILYLQNKNAFLLNVQTTIKYNT